MTESSFILQMQIIVIVVSNVVTPSLFHHQVKWDVAYRTFGIEEYLMEGVHIRIMDSMFPSLTSSNPAVQLHIHGQTRSFSILKMWPTLGYIFVPRLQTYNDQRRTLIRAVLLILDESISAWCPKTSKLGCIPNISYKPRKPIPLGNMFNNGVEYISGVLTFQDKFQGPEKKQQKTYFG